ncbi:ATP-binding cassette domain-containing protein [Acerihabitans arboris]|uniref:ATP-binding cassette domain-containing protein n=1 Tax=Acerihabitans arboris TaxID=2691583 RepID=A0A845SCC4_9GAMM|nr:ATP-binding cassette domain-containing protein [Acerihabitans arboris]NDL61559.1 ATP-binding cassette domain-containing protein [Acerihabitans arboris]
MIKLEKGGKFHTTRTIKTLALNGVDLRVGAGDFLAIMGPSGSGKSTLLNVLGMFESLDEGRLILAGENVSALGHAQKIALRRRLIGYIFQSFNLIPSMSVHDNVALPLKYRGVAKPERRQRVDQILEVFGLEHRAGHHPAQLSGGQQQRVAIARAMVCRPGLILADEPTGNLDSKNSRDVLAQLKKINLEGTTVVMVTHSQEASNYANRVMTMRDGYLE